MAGDVWEDEAGRRPLPASGRATLIKMKMSMMFFFFPLFRGICFNANSLWGVSFIYEIFWEFLFFPLETFRWSFLWILTQLINLFTKYNKLLLYSNKKFGFLFLWFKKAFHFHRVRCNTFYGPFASAAASSLVITSLSLSLWRIFMQNFLTDIFSRFWWKFLKINKILSQKKFFTVKNFLKHFFRKKKIQKSILTVF